MSEFNRLHKLRTDALESDDIGVVKKAVEEFSNLWLNVAADLDYYKCILDGTWPLAENRLIAALSKLRENKAKETLKKQAGRK